MRLRVVINQSTEKSLQTKFAVVMDISRFDRGACSVCAREGGARTALSKESRKKKHRAIMGIADRIAMFSGGGTPSKSEASAAAWWIDLYLDLVGNLDPAEHFLIRERTLKSIFQKNSLPRMTNYTMK